MSSFSVGRAGRRTSLFLWIFLPLLHAQAINNENATILHHHRVDSTSSLTEKEIEILTQKCGAASSELARELGLARTTRMETERRLRHLQLEHKFMMNALKREKSVAVAALQRARLAPLLEEAVRTRELLNAMFTNATLRLFEENVSLRLNNSELAHARADLVQQVKFLTQENVLLEANLLELNRDNLRLQSSYDELVLATRRGRQDVTVESYDLQIDDATDKNEPQ